MSLKEQLLSDLKGAMKQRDALRLNTIRSVTSEIKNQEINSRSELSDDEVLSIVTSQIKKRKEAADLFKKGGRPELSDKEDSERSVLETYLPEQVSEADLRLRIAEVIAESNASSLRDMGKVMKTVVPEFKGKADNSLIKNIVSELLGQTD